jgi:hypothetical protein
MNRVAALAALTWLGILLAMTLIDLGSRALI